MAALRRRLRMLATANGKSGSNQVAIRPVLKPGARRVRKWHGRTHTVHVLDERFEHEGRRYGSFTEIAKAITGAHWSGPRFFGLKATRTITGAGS